MDTLKEYLALCWFEGDPLDLPRSYRFLKQNWLYYYFSELFMQYNMVNDLLDAFIDVTEETILTIVLIFLILALNRSLNRFVQVASALIVSENLTGTIAIPVVAWLAMSGSILSYVLLSIIIVWELLIISYIFKLVLNINQTASVVMGIIYFIVTYLGVYGLNLVINL